jgi:hypothetical protein
MIDILYIWNGKNELPDNRIICIENTHNVYPDCTYHCLTNKTPLPFLEPISWDDEMLKVASFFAIDNIPKQWEDFMTFSDWYRFYHLINHPNTLYLDTDCKINKMYDFESRGKLIYPQNEIFLLYSPINGSFAKIKPLLDHYASTGYHGKLLGVNLYFRNKDFTEILDKSIYEHI